MAFRRWVKWVAVLGVSVALSACASTGPREGFAKTDHYEPTSRAIHQNNLRVDRFVIRPLAKGYDFVMPKLFKHMVGNGLNHVDLPNDFANYVLQGDIEASLETLGRFTINTIVGMGGFLDPATEFGLPKESTDFGMTLARYGVGEGSYVVLPLLGPSTVRDTFGFVVDRALSPLAYVGPFTALDGLSPAVTATELIHRRDAAGEVIDDIFYESEDSYVSLRSAYLQRRRADIAGEDGAVDAIPDIFDDETPSN